MSDLVNIMQGYVNYYVRVKDYHSVREASLWLINYLASLKKSKDTVAYVDKIIAPYYAECAHLSELMGATDDIRMYLQKANEVAERYDKNPTYNGSGHVFWIKDDDGGVIYDDIGVNASDAIEKMLVREQWNEGLKDIWENIRRGTNLNETME